MCLTTWCRRPFVSLDELPLTPSGKIDRLALPAPEARRRRGELMSRRGRRSRKCWLRIWAEVLDLERVGVNDDFFELGGHSLLATRLIMRVRATFAIELPVRALFEAPTVSRLARTT